MKITLIITLLITQLTQILLGSNMAMADDSITLLHYNIKELDTTKLLKSNSQLSAVKKVISKFKPDLVSINEIQYDFPNVPTTAYQSKGQNLSKLRSLLKLNNLTNISFNPANTGLDAKPNSEGVYYSNPNSPEARKSSDQVNFGTLPGQYSSGLLSKFKIIKENIFSTLKWKDFNPAIDFSQFKLADGSDYPEDAELFDKNFSDIIIDVNGKEVHIILLHTVPAYHFGNMKSPNFKRNADQLKFLEWYLTGSTDIQVKLKNIKPLKSSDYYIATGDWNTAYDSQTNPGSEVLRSLYKKSNLWLDSTDALSFTNEGSGYSEKPFRLMLDYIATSKNIITTFGSIIHPNLKTVQLGCGPYNELSKPQGFVSVQWIDKKKTCKAFVHSSYRDFKEASDHYPIIGKFLLK